MSDKLSIVLFSGTEDKLHAAATITAGAAAMGMPVSVLLMYWGLDAFRADRIDNDDGLAYDASRPRWNEPVEPSGRPVLPGTGGEADGRTTQGGRQCLSRRR